MPNSTLNARLQSHLGRSRPPHVIHRSFADFLAGDIAIAVNEWLVRADASLFRFAGDPQTLFDVDGEGVPEVASPVLEYLEVAGDVSRQGVREGLALFHIDDAPIAVQCHWNDTHPQHYRLTVLTHDLERGKRFLDDFSRFAETRRAITSPLFQRIAASLNTRLRAHLGEGPSPGVLHRTFPEYQITNVSILVKAFFEDLEAEFTGCGASSGLAFHRGDDPLAWLKPAGVDRFGHFEGHDQTAPVYEKLRVDARSRRMGLLDGVVLFRFDDAPMFAICRRSSGSHQTYELTVVARDLERAQRVLEAFLAYESAHSIFRGRLIRPDIDYSDRITEAEILPFEEVSWARIVLPDRLRDRIERDVLSYVRAADALAANGVVPRRSVLFHGAPGTGKTLMCKVIATELRGVTSILVAGDNLTHPAAAFALARSLAPAVIFFEDVDLVGRNRETNGYALALGGLMNELDGLAGTELIYVVFTTNRLPVLEEALAQRPGRVDLIVGFPLPEPALRRRLLRLYAGCTRVRDADIDWLVEETDGVTPAFLRELMKEAVFTAITHGAVDESGIADVERTHLHEALERIAEIRREHGADRILGFRA